MASIGKSLNITLDLVTGIFFYMFFSVQCFNVTALENGYLIDLPLRDNFDTYVDTTCYEVVTYSCDKGYALVGLSTRTCVHNGVLNAKILFVSVSLNSTII